MPPAGPCAADPFARRARLATPRRSGPPWFETPTAAVPPGPDTSPARSPPAGSSPLAADGVADQQAPARSASGRPPRSCPRLPLPCTRHGTTASTTQDPASHSAQLYASLGAGLPKNSEVRALCNGLVRVILSVSENAGTSPRRPGSLASECRVSREHQVRRLGPNAYGEQLRPGRVLVVAPAALLAEQIPQPDGQVLYELLTGHPDRAPRDLVFLADLTTELRAWPQQRWTDLGVSPEVALLAVVEGWRARQVKGLEVGGVSVEEARALGRPAMTYVREQLRGRLASEISRQYLRWLHPTSRRRPGERFL